MPHDQSVPKWTLQIECRKCGDIGWYEDIADDWNTDDEEDKEYGLCSECEPTKSAQKKLVGKKI